MPIQSPLRFICDETLRESRIWAPPAIHPNFCASGYERRPLSTDLRSRKEVEKEEEEEEEEEQMRCGIERQKRGVNLLPHTVCLNHRTVAHLLNVNASGVGSRTLSYRLC